MRLSTSPTVLIPARLRWRANSICTRSTRWVTTLRIDRGSEPAESADLKLGRLKRPPFRYYDVLTSSPTNLLKAALKTYLPKESYATHELRFFMMGHQYAYFRPSLSGEMLCQDGTDTKFLPGPEDIWKYRLWAGGSVTTSSLTPVYLHHDKLANVTERAIDVRVVAKEGRADKVFVNIERTFRLYQQPRLDTKIEVRKKPYRGLRIMTEVQKLCFLREPPASMQDERNIKPPSDPIFTHTMTPSQLLLFQFSALTHNAHKIHIDREFARKEYGARDLLVHGPLTHVLMVEFLYRYLRSLQQQASYHIVPRQMDYTNLQPLFVDEPLTLCCKPTPGQASDGDGRPQRFWQVWVQKGEGANASCAVKATIDVGYVNRSVPRFVLSAADIASGAIEKDTKPSTTTSSE